MRRGLNEVVGILSIGALSGCFPKAGPLPGPLPSESIVRAQSRWPAATEESLEKGRGLFATYCDNCHHYPDLREYSETKWPEIVRRMSKKSGISPDDSERVLHFVLAARADLTGPVVVP